MTTAFYFETNALASVPESWERRPLWTLIKRRDITNRSDTELLSVYRDHGVVPKASREGNFNKPSEDLSPYKYVRRGDLVLNKMKTWQGSIAVSEYEGIVSPAYYVCEVSDQVNYKFLHYLLRSRPYIGFYQALSKGIRPNQWDLPFEEFRSLSVGLPDWEEQRRIADFLDAEVARLDSLVYATEAQLYALRERLSEFMRVMTTTGGEADVAFTGVSWMPLMNKAWKLRKVGHYFQAGSGTTPKSDSGAYFGGEHFWVNTGDLRDSVVEKPRKTVSAEALVVYPTLKIYDPGSLVVAMYGATTGRVGILGVPACVNQACCVLSELGGVDSQFAFYWFQAHRNEILGLASGGGQPNINQELVRGLRIPSPDVESQSRIVFEISDVAGEVRTQEALLQKRKRLLEERKRALITAAVTGQIDVTTARGADVS